MNFRRPQRKVLLALQAEHLSIDVRLLTSACGLCQRLDAELDILVRASDEPLPAPLQNFLAALRAEGINYVLNLKPGLRQRDIVRYANSHECISAVIIDALDAWAKLDEERADNPWVKLACPLISTASDKTSS